MSELLGQIQNGKWIGKLGLPIPDDVTRAIDNPVGWFKSLPPIQFLSEDNAPTLFNVANYLPDNQLAETVKNSSLVFLETAYGTNKCYNSLKHRNLLGQGQAILSRLPTTKNEVSIRDTATLASSFFLNLPYLDSKEIGYSGTIGADIPTRIAELQNQNRSFLEKLMSDLMKSIDELVGGAKRSAKRAIKKLEKILNQGNSASSLASSQPAFSQLASSQLASSQLAAGGLALPAVTAVGASINLLQQITSWLLSSFLMKSVIGVGGLISAIAATSSAIVLKSLESKGADVMRYIAGGIMRQNVNLLPAIWNASGTFTGAWGFLMATAPYIILAAVIAIAAIELTKKTDVGDRLYILGKRNAELDLLYARFTPTTTKAEIIQEIQELKNKLINESGKTYQNIYGFTFAEQEQKLGIDLSAQVAIPIKQEQSTSLWNQLSNSAEFKDLMLTD